MKICEMLYHTSALFESSASKRARSKQGKNRSYYPSKNKHNPKLFHSSHVETPSYSKR